MYKSFKPPSEPLSPEYKQSNVFKTFWKRKKRKKIGRKIAGGHNLTFVEVLNGKSVKKSQLARRR